MILWLMLIKGKANWKFTKAEPPCNKGEIIIPLHWYHITIGWQEREEAKV